MAGALVVDPGGWFPFTVAKWWAVIVVVLAASACAMAIGSWPRSSRLGRATDWSLVALVTIIATSAVVAVDGVYAWIGTPVRHLGALTWVLFAMAYAVGRSVGVHERSRDVTFVAFVIAGVGVAAYGAVEWVAGPPIDFVGSSSRLGGPFGSAAYLGAALCLVAPIAVGATVVARRRIARFGGAALTLVLVAVLAGSGSRAPVVGLSVAAVVVVVGAPGVRRRQRTVFAAAASVALGVVAVGVARGGWERSFGWGSRLDEWVLAVRAIGDRPWLGAGPEGYRLVVGQAVDSGYVQRYGEAVGVDRAHSGVLDVAAASGLLAALMYLAVLGFVGAACIRLIRRGDARDVACAAAVIAYGVQQQLLFPIAELDPAFWLLAGIVVSRAWGRCGVPSASAGSTWRVVLAGLVASIALAGAVLGVRAAAADRLARSSFEAASVENAIRRVDRATELAPLDVRHRLLLADTYGRELSLGAVDRALDAVADAARISSRDPDVRYAGARLAGLRAAITGSPADRAVAEQTWDELLVDWPLCARCHVGAALAAYERGDTADGQAHLDRAIELGSDDARALADELRGD